MRHSMPIAITLCGAIVACGNVSPDPPTDATDADATDTHADTATDVPLDTPADPPPDSPADTTPDTTPDTAPDTSPDTEPDTEPDPPLDLPEWDIPEDWPADNPADWPYTTPIQCSNQGGFCSGGISLPCPAGYEPLVAPAHRHCDADGWCCVPAPYSPCSESGTSNCMAATSCAAAEDGCWTDDPTDLECEPGRVCCVNSCT